MKHFELSCALATCGLLAVAVPAQAHHSASGEFDLLKPIEFSGTVVKMEFVNPHSALHLEVTNADGTKTMWVFQTGAIDSLRRQGLVRSSAQGGLKAGDHVTASGFAARSGNPVGLLSVLTLASGRVIKTGIN